MLRWSTARPINKLNHINVTQSLQGIPLPIVFGCQRVPGLLIWYGDFKAHQHQAGGKGLGGKGGTTYTYSASWLVALCQGAIWNVRAIWDQSGSFIPQSAVATETIPAGGTGLTLSGFAGQLAGTGGAGGIAGYTQVSWPPTWTPGVSANPLTPGQYAIDPATGHYYFADADAGNSVSIAYNYWSDGRLTQEQYLVPSGGSVIVRHSGTAPDSKPIFLQDQGVFDEATGNPVVGYSQSGGVYSGLTPGQLISIRYVYYLYQDDKFAPHSLGFTIFDGQQGQAPWSYLSGSHPDYALGYSLTAYVAFQNGYLGASGQLPNYSFEVQGFHNIGYGSAGIIDDAPPIDCFFSLLTDLDYGIGYPGANIDLDTWYNNANSASAWARAAYLFISQAVTNQDTVASIAGRWLEACQIASFCSEGKLKLVPFADQAASSDLASYTPNVDIVAYLDDDSFLASAGEDPVTVARSPWTDCYNRAQIGFVSRANGYNSDLAYASDDASIQRFGFRPEPPQNYDFITGPKMAAKVASLRIKRLTGLRNKYTFRLPIRYEYLEPMDIVAITDARLNFVQLPVRIIQIENDYRTGLKISAEDAPPGAGIGNPTPPKIVPATPPGHPVVSTVSAGKTWAMILQAPYSSSGRLSQRIYIYCLGEDPNWSGCTVWVSLDGSNYSAIETVTSPARIGTLLDALPTMTPAPSGAYGLTSDTSDTLKIAFGKNIQDPNALTATATTDFPDGHFDPNHSYAAGNAALWDGSLWLAIQPSTGQQPTASSPYWQLVSSAQPAGIALSTVSSAVAENLGTLSAIVKIDATDHKTPRQVELLSYEHVAAGTELNSYDLTTLFRGAYASLIQAFDAGDSFVRFDDASATYDVPSGMVGQTIYFRFTAWNAGMGTTQSLDMADTYAVVVSETPGAAIDMGSGAASVNVQTGTTYTIKNSDFGNLIVFNNTAAVTVTMPHPSTLRNGFKCSVQNQGTGEVTLSPTSPDTIDNAATLVLHSAQGAGVYTKDSDWHTERGGAGTSPSAGIGGVDVVTGTFCTITSANKGHLVTLSNASAIAVSLDDASTVDVEFVCAIQNQGAGTATLTPASGTIDGVANLALTQGQGVFLFSDGTNWQTQRGRSGLPAEQSVTITTGSLATGATETGTVTIAKTYIITAVSFDRSAWTRLYTTAALRTADATRPQTTPPVIGSQHGVTFDVALNSTTGLNWASASPPGLGSNREASRSAAIPYAIRNLDAAHTVTVTIKFIPLEA